MAATQRKPPADKITRIALDQLHFMPNCPIAQREDSSFWETVNSVKENGVLQPAIVRPLESGGYEIIAGRRRKIASELAGLPDMPCMMPIVPLTAIAENKRPPAAVGVRPEAAAPPVQAAAARQQSLLPPRLLLHRKLL